MLGLLEPRNLDWRPPESWDPDPEARGATWLVLVSLKETQWVWLGCMEKKDLEPTAAAARVEHHCWGDIDS